jgi:aminoglycoside phosphotransferase (APT) family kinase protein
VSADRRARCVAAAIAVARAQGLRVTDPVVISEGSRVLVHLRPAPIVARVAASTPGVRPDVGTWLEREVAVATFLAGRGARVVPPTDLVPPGPHRAGSLTVTLWAFVDHAPRARIDGASAGRALAELHEALAPYPGALPFLDPALDEVARLIDAVERAGALSPGDADRLRREHGDIERAIRAADHVQPLHGDAWSGNLVVSQGELLWTDFEDACIGPIAWDLACLRMDGPMDGGFEMAARAGITDAGLGPFLRARGLQTVAWALMRATRDAGRLDLARGQLAAWLDGPARPLG